MRYTKLKKNALVPATVRHCSFFNIVGMNETAFSTWSSIIICRITEYVTTLTGIM